MVSKFRNFWLCVFSGVVATTLILEYFRLLNLKSTVHCRTSITQPSLMTNATIPAGQMNEDETVRWEKYLEQCNPSGDPSHSLDAGLMMPIQRISDYPAMCREIQIRGHVRSGVLHEKIGSKFL